MNKQFITVLLLLIFSINNISCQKEEYQYDPELSLDFLFYTKSSYCTVEDIESWSCICCPHNKQTIDIKVFQNIEQETLGYTAYNPEQNLIIVAFRGSVTVLNFEDDADDVLVDYPFCEGCQVHKGHLRQWNSLEEQCLEQVKNLKEKYPDAKILSTGHSLGGSLSFLGAFAIFQEGFTVDYLYNYGAPRIGNPALAEYGHKIIPGIMRVVHTRDPAPHSPSLEKGYLQVPTEVWYYSKQEPKLFKVCYMPGVEEDPDCSDSLDRYNFLNHFVYLQNDVGCNLRTVDAIEEEQEIIFN